MGTLVFTMAGAEKFCLKWNDFESNISDAFKDLREQKDFFDVTLACDDNSQIEAHKVILSACSPFFRNILRRNPHQHPLLYIKGVKYKELVAILDFMYMGEVNVVQDELNTFLVVAEELKVKGLTQNSSKEQNSKSNKTQEPLKPSIKEPPEKDPKRPRPPQVSQTSMPPLKLMNRNFANDDDDDIQEVVPVKSEPNEDSSRPPLQNFVEISNPDPEVAFQNQEITSMAVDDGFVIDESYSYDQYYEDGLMNRAMGAPMDGGDPNKDFVALINSKMTKLTKITRLPGENPNLWQCNECEYSSVMRCNMKAHIEAKHIQHDGYYCALCNKTCPSKSAFRMHNKRNHETPKGNSGPSGIELTNEDYF